MGGTEKEIRAVCQENRYQACVWGIVCERARSVKIDDVLYGDRKKSPNGVKLTVARQAFVK